MTGPRGFGLHFFATALILFLSISLSAGEVADHDERTELLPWDRTDPEDGNGVAPVIDSNGETKVEKTWPFLQNRRVRRGIRFPNVGPGLRAAYHTAPKTLAGFPHLVRMRPKGSVQGGGGMRKRWKDENTKRIYEWDSRHGELEGYSKNGEHLGAFNPQTGQKIKNAVPGRRLQN